MLPELKLTGHHHASRLWLKLTVPANRLKLTLSDHDTMLKDELKLSD